MLTTCIDGVVSGDTTCKDRVFSDVNYLYRRGGL